MSYLIKLGSNPQNFFEYLKQADMTPQKFLRYTQHTNTQNNNSKRSIDMVLSRFDELTRKKLINYAQKYVKESPEYLYVGPSSRNNSGYVEVKPFGPYTGRK
jgi:hypothetical protein